MSGISEMERQWKILGIGGKPSKAVKPNPVHLAAQWPRRISAETLAKMSAEIINHQ